MTRRTLQRRLACLADRREPPVPSQFRVFARAVIVFGGHQPTAASVEQLARWSAGGYRTQPLPD